MVKSLGMKTDMPEEEKDHLRGAGVYPVDQTYDSLIFPFPQS